MLLQKDKFIKAGIPYEDLDIEMIDIIDVLNFKLNLKTSNCCYGHENGARLMVMFDMCVTDKDIYPLAKYLCDKKVSFNFNKYLRVGNKLIENWILEINSMWNKNNTDIYINNKEYHVRNILNVLNEYS